MVEIDPNSKPVCWISFVVKVFSAAFGKQSIRVGLLPVEMPAQLREERSGAGRAKATRGASTDRVAWALVIEEFGRAEEIPTLCG